MRGILLVNLGTPDQADVASVRRYLRQFLSDPRVVDIPAVLRWILLNLIILPFRSPKSAHAYQSIWTKRGSPLQVFTTDLAQNLQSKLPDMMVRHAMRYQNPSVKKALQEFAQAGVDDLTIVPLFPQYSSAAWGSAAEEVLDQSKLMWNVPSVNFVKPFYDRGEWAELYAKRTRELMEKPWDHVIFSYHGLPERHCQKSDLKDGKYCLATPNCCDTITAVNRFCYRAQCVATTRFLVDRLQLRQDQWTLAFQSRLGRTPWIKPYTDIEIERLAKEGKKDIIVVSPSFVADCLETLEEIEVRAVEQFQELGGKSLRLVPSLNADDDWVEVIRSWVLA